MPAALARSGHRIPKKGDVASFPFGTYTAKGLVIEDRGPLGRGGEQILRVRVDLGDDLEPLLTEIPARVVGARR